MPCVGINCRLVTDLLTRFRSEESPVGRPGSARLRLGALGLVPLGRCDAELSLKVERVPKGVL